MNDQETLSKVLDRIAPLMNDQETLSKVLDRIVPLTPNLFGTVSNLKKQAIEGEFLRRFTYAHTSDDIKARILMNQYLAKTLKSDPTEEKLVAFTWCQTPIGSLSTMWKARWADQAFPTIKISEKLAASFMATGFHPSASIIKPPWRALAIIPPDTLAFTGNDGLPEKVKCVRVLATNDIGFKDAPKESPFAWFISGVGERGAEIHTVSAAECLFKPHVSGDPFPNILSKKMDKVDERVLEMLTRLVGGVCLEMSDPRTLETSKRGKAHGRNTRFGAPPEPRIYELSRHVSLDVRDEIKAYIQGRIGSKPSVQTLVAGHWKHQRCGVNGSSRKLIHVEPYWRGPELAPILAKTVA